MNGGDRMTVAMKTRCPWCLAEHEAATGVGARTPCEGDRMLCIECGEISIFAAAHWGGMRKPTADENEAMSRNPLIFDVRRLWFEGMRNKPWRKKPIA
jgi:hypothetical protein